MKFRTRSGSVYELDEVNKRARQLEGKRSSQRATPEWRDYDDALVVVGLPAFISWTSATPLLEETVAEGLEDVARPATQTSQVLEIINDEPVLH